MTQLFTIMFEWIIAIILQIVEMNSNYLWLFIRNVKTKKWNFNDYCVLVSDKRHRPTDTAVIKKKRVKFNRVLTVRWEVCLLMEIPLKVNVSTGTQIMQYPYYCSLVAFHWRHTWACVTNAMDVKNDTKTNTTSTSSQTWALIGKNGSEDIKYLLLMNDFLSSMF